jgi:hypothetical protein
MSICLFTTNLQAFDTVTQQWRSLAPMLADRVFSGCAALPSNPNKFIIMGNVNRADIFDASLNKW